jgi:integrase
MQPHDSATNHKSEWQKTPFANLIRFNASQVYFARIRIKGKLIRRSLKTKALSVAKLRLNDFEKSERQRVQSFTAITQGKMTFADAIGLHLRRTHENPALKPRTKEYTEYRIKALLKSWPGLSSKDISRISSAECLDWSIKNANTNSSSSHNHTVSILRNVFRIAIEYGARYDNPAVAANRVRERTEKQVELPEFNEFERLVEVIKSSGSGHAKPAAELVKFLAYGGLRLGEAKYVTWQDCDFTRREIVIRGHPETGTKNNEIRRIPMIPDMQKFLEALRLERQSEEIQSPVMRVRECQKSINRAVKILNIKRITHHDLRHLFATRAIESGVDIPTVSRWLGHKDGGALAMKTYGHLRNEHSRAMADRVSFTSSQTFD